MEALFEEPSRPVPRAVPSARCRLILHGKQAEFPALREEVARLREAGHLVDVRVTWERGDAARYAREAAADGVERLVSGGGDGTLNEIAGALAGLPAPSARLPALAVLPLGTANDFATAVALPDDLREALDFALAGPLHPVDAVRVQCDGQERWFVNVATGGFGTEVTTETPEELKRTLGRLAYLLTGLARFGALRSAHGRFRGEGFAWEGDFLVLGLGNARSAGGGHVLCPGALLDDGLLDVAILPAPEENVLSEVLGTLFMEGRAGLEENAVRARVPALDLEASAGLTLNLDGEPMQGTAFRIEVVPRRLRMPLPRGCALLSP